MRVLSLFDGMSCGQIALLELGITPEIYYASEIDKRAIKQTQLNFPDTIQLGDVEDWWLWDIDFSKIDLILAGSPCQGFSFAGKGLAFDDPRSRLFFVFIDILNHCKKLNPEIKFLLENVRMKKEYRKVITDMCGVEPININSNLVSAQNRNRWYWTNIEDISQPEDKGIFLRDILESEVDEKYYVSQAVINRMNKPNKNFVPKINPSKTGCLTTKNNSAQMSFDSGTTFISIAGKAPTQRNATGRSLDKNHNYQFIKVNVEGKVSPNQDKSSCFTAGGHSGGHSGGYHSDMDLICVEMRGREACLTPKRTEYGKAIRKDYELGKTSEKRGNMQSLEPRSDGKTNCLTSVQKDNLILQRPRGYNQGALFADMSSGTHAIAAERIRRLTPTECSRLQTIPAWYHWGCSDTQIYRMLGNGWTVDVIKHILKNLFFKIISK